MGAMRALIGPLARGCGITVQNDGEPTNALVLAIPRFRHEGYRMQAGAPVHLPIAWSSGREIRPRPSVRVIRGAGSGQHLASVLQEGRENANIDAGLGFIWRISA